VVDSVADEFAAKMAEKVKTYAVGEPSAVFTKDTARGFKVASQIEAKQFAADHCNKRLQTAE